MALSATRQILKHYPGARIVIVTDYNDDGLRSAAREAGACAYALKNNLTELDAVVRAALISCRGREPCARVGLKQSFMQRSTMLQREPRQCIRAFDV